MEEVFLKVNKLPDSQGNTQSSKAHYLKDTQLKQKMEQNVDIPRSFERPSLSYFSEIDTIKFNSGFPLYRQQFYSMFMKRALFIWCNWKLMLLEIIAICIVTTYLLLALNSEDNHIPERELNLSHYGQTIVPYSVSGNSDLALNLTKNLEIFLKSKNQELRKIEGDVNDYILESKEGRIFCIIALSIEVEKNQTLLTILFNSKAHHSPAISLAVLDNILFMSLSGPSASITAFNKPQPLPHYGSNTVPINGLQIVQCLAFGISAVVGSFCVQTVTERISKAKHIQFLSGVYVLAYWLSALLCDLIFFFIPCCVLLGVFKFCEVDAFIVNYNFLDTMLIFMLYGWCVVPLVYLGSLLFTSSTAAYIKLTLFNYFSIIFSVIIYTILQFYENDFPDLMNTLIRTMLMMIPSYNFAMSISKFFDDYQVKELCAKEFRSIYIDCSETFTQNNVYGFGEHGIGKFLITLAAMGLIFLLLLLSLETVSWSLKNFVFRNIIFNLYTKFRKSKAVRSRIGYCPQSESVLNHMTGRELLIMYARLWGVQEQDIHKYVDAFLCSLHLEPLVDQFISTYSGGSKRRLSIAIALTGNSSVVFLDEPSTGMDPPAQHLLWDTVTWFGKTGKAVIITSHRMEECEALCTRLAFMVKGKFSCLGSPQHIWRRFGHVYTLTAKINIAKDEAKVEKFKNFIKKTFPGNVKNQELQGIIGYYIPSKEICWGKEAKVLFNLEDYFVRQVTLEQLFLTFANADKMGYAQEIKLL